jgi:hypothetical protein
VSIFGTGVSLLVRWLKSWVHTTSGLILRNLFDQYLPPENRATDALMTALDRDRKPLGFFLKQLERLDRLGVSAPYVNFGVLIALTC